jgi:hypothetical protein
LLQRQLTAGASLSLRPLSPDRLGLASRIGPAPGVAPIWCSETPYFVLKAVAPNLAYKGLGKFVNRPTTTGGKKYDKFFVYVPTDVAKDSAFPFKPGDSVEVRIDSRGRQLSIAPVNHRQR